MFAWNSICDVTLNPIFSSYIRKRWTAPSSHSESLSTWAAEEVGQIYHCSYELRMNLWTTRTRWPGLGHILNPTSSSHQIRFLTCMRREESHTTTFPRRRVKRCIFIWAIIHRSEIKLWKQRGAHETAHDVLIYLARQLARVHRCFRVIHPLLSQYCLLLSDQRCTS